jgi:hypothetical protein
MRPSLVTRRAARFGLAAVAFLLTALSAVAADRKIEARLIWGTNDEKSPEPSHKPLDGELAKKLTDMPLKWKNYFEVKKLVFDINDKAYTNIVMSKKCAIEVKDKGNNNVTVKLYGEGKQVNRVDKPLPKGEVLVIGGEDKGNNAWFITVRPVNAAGKPDASKAPSSPSAAAKPAPPK